MFENMEIESSIILKLNIVKGNGDRKENVEIM